MKPGDSVFVISEMSRDGVFERTAVLPASVCAVSDDGIDVEVSHDGQTRGGRLLSAHVFSTADDAERSLAAILAKRQRMAVKAAAGGTTAFLPERLRPLTSVMQSGNFLRAGEHGVMLTVMTNSIGKEKNAQKLLQLAGAAMEEISVLWSVLDVIGYGNDFAKKAIAKHIIIEMESLRACFAELARVDSRCKPAFDHLTKELGRQKLVRGDFRSVRDKVGGHRDPSLTLHEMVALWRRITRANLSRALDAFTDHVNALRAIYPYEIPMQFPPTMPLFMTVTMPATHAAEYAPFDAPLEDDEK